MTGTLPQPLRSDAQDNLDRVLAAARELFAVEGLQVTMRRIARQAGVGPATLYRRFATKQDLVVAAFADEMRTCADIVADGAADPDPWRGLCGIIERITVVNVQNRGFTDAFLATYPDQIDFVAHRVGLAREVDAVARRAQAAGKLRSDFVLDDFVLLLLAGRGLTATAPAQRIAAAHRFAALAIDGLRAPATAAPC